MRTQDGKLIIDIGDSVSETISGTFSAPEKSSVDENKTQYSLYPVDINKVPIITKTIYEASEPQIVREEISNTRLKSNLFLSSDGTVKVSIGSNYTLGIEAEQPTTLNIDNGVPVIKQKQEDLAYVWSKDGSYIPNTTYLVLEGGGSSLNIDTATSYIKAEGNKLIFFNVTPEAAGNYSCEIRNDIGSVVSEPISISVYDPTSTYDSFFSKNLIQNAFANEGTNGWTSIQGNIKSTAFLKQDDNAVESLQTTLKRPNDNKLGYIADQFYPHPSNIRVLNVGNYELHSISAGNAKYFNRDLLQYLLNGGVKKVAVYQDIDLSTITDYIQGKVYGVSDVKAFFGCYIGNALSRACPTQEAVPPSTRYLADYYFNGAPRLSVENFLKVGLIKKVESLEVVVQELNGETPLTSRYITPANKAFEVRSISIKDPLTKAIEAVIQENKTPSVYPIDSYQVGYTLKTQDEENIILRAYEKLYNENLNRYYTNGQYVEYNPIYIDGLNKKTNKVRINLVFDITDERFYEYKESAVDGLLDLAGEEKANKSGTFRSQMVGPNDPRWPKTNQQIVDESPDGKTLPNKPAKTEREKNLSGTESRPMVTGLCFSLHPTMEKTKALIGTTAKEFKNSVIQLPSKAEDILKRSILPAPLDTTKKFNKIATSNQKWKYHFIQTKKGPVDRFKLKIEAWKYDDKLQQYTPQANFPIFSTTAFAMRDKAVSDLGTEGVNNALDRGRNDIVYKDPTKVPLFVNTAPSKNNNRIVADSNNIQPSTEVLKNKILKWDSDETNLTKGLLDDYISFRILLFGLDLGGSKDGLNMREIKIDQGAPSPNITYWPKEFLTNDGYIKFEDAVGDGRANDPNKGLDLADDGGKSRPGFEDEVYIYKVYRAINGHTTPLEWRIVDNGITYDISYQIFYEEIAQ